MPLVRFTRGIIWKGQSVGPGDTAEVTDPEAFRLCEAYKDAERVDGKTMFATHTGLVDNVVQTRDPVAEHRDPVAPSSKRKK